MSHANAPTIPLRGRAEIRDRLEIREARRLLLVEGPPVFVEILTEGLDPERTLTTVEARALRSVKESFDWILLWQENRVGSRAVFDGARKRLEPDGRLWVVTALKKVQGPKTPAAHRLEPGDLVKAFEKEGLVGDREVRISAWHVAHRFIRASAKPTRDGYST
jgi:hypothetical protein